MSAGGCPGLDCNRKAANSDKSLMFPRQENFTRNDNNLFEDANQSEFCRFFGFTFLWHLHIDVNVDDVWAWAAG